MARKMLTDRQWKRLARHFPGKKGDPGRTATDNRLAVEAMLWIARTGAPWRDLPEKFGKWITAYQRFRRWALKGMFGFIFNQVRRALKLDSIMIDGTILRVHQHGTGSKKAAGRPAEKP